MRSGGGDGVEELTACGLLAYHAIPGSFPELTTPDRTNRGTTGHFRISLGDAGGLVGIAGCALFRRLTYRAGGCHQAREGNTDRSTHWHCIVSFSLGIPLPRAKKSRCLMPIILDEQRNTDRCGPGIPHGTGHFKIGTSKARQYKTPLSTLA